MGEPGRTWHINDFARPLWHADLAQAIDTITSSDFGISGLTLMENAAKAVVHQMRQIPDFKARTVIVLAGQGNNGGDGLAIARLLQSEGIAPTVFMTGEDPARLSPECAEQLKRCRAAGIIIQPWQENCLARWMSLPVIVVDAVFGLGFRGPLLTGVAASMLREAEHLTRKVVVAVDLPSGMNADSGDLPEGGSVLLPASMTVTFGEWKPLHALAPARDACGVVYCADIGFPEAAIALARRNHPPCFLIADDRKLLVKNPWGALPPSANKFDRGHVMVLGGSPGKTGAPYLTGLAALRSGVGWVSLSLPENAKGGPSFAAPPEITYESFWTGPRLDAEAIETFLTARRVRAVVVGPGTMEQPVDDRLAAVLAAFTRSGGGVVFDAGATRGLLPILLRHRWDINRVLCTPHPGEWGRIGEVLPNPQSCTELEGLAPALADVAATFVYKGATPVIVNGAGQTKPALICAGGSNILARAGTGDVIAGVAAAHMAAGIPADISFARSYALVARTARLVAEKIGSDAVLATDIIHSLGVKE